MTAAAIIVQWKAARPYCLIFQRCAHVGIPRKNHSTKTRLYDASCFNVALIAAAFAAASRIAACPRRCASAREQAPGSPRRPRGREDLAAAFAAMLLLTSWAAAVGMRRMRASR